MRGGALILNVGWSHCVYKESQLVTYKTYNCTKFYDMEQKV